MNKILAYILTILGLIVIILSINAAKLKLPDAIKPAYIMILGLVMVILGIVLTMNKGKATQIAEEVPIYHGNKIVGYRKAHK